MKLTLLVTLVAAFFALSVFAGDAVNSANNTAPSHTVVQKGKKKHKKNKKGKKHKANADAGAGDAGAPPAGQ